MDYPDDEVTKVQKQGGVWPIILCLWGLLVLFTAYDTTAVRDQAQKSEFLAESAGVEKVLDFANQIGEVTGLAKLRSAFSEIRNGLNEKYLAFRIEEKDEGTSVVEKEKLPEPVEPDSATETKEQGLQHRMTKPKRRVLVVGASSIQFAIGSALEKQIPTYEGVQVRRFGKLASGLARPDFFDWPAQIRKLLKEFKPDLMIANFGGNGAQGIPLGKRKSAKFETPQWDEAYTSRVHEIIDMAHEAGADVAFLGMPNMRSKKFAKKMRYLNRVQKKAAESRGAIWVSSWNWTSDSKGKYRKSIKVGKKRGLMRTSDGIHYSKLGAKFVVSNMLSQLESRYSWAKPNEPVVRHHQLVRTSTQVVYALREYRPTNEQTMTNNLVWLELESGVDSASNCYVPADQELKQFVAKTGVVVLVPSDCSYRFTEELTFQQSRDLVSQGLKLPSEATISQESVKSSMDWEDVTRKFLPKPSTDETQAR